MLCHPRISRIQRTRFLSFSNSPEAGRFLGNRIGIGVRQSVASHNSSQRVPLEDAERDNEKHWRNIPPRTDSSQEKRILKDSLPFLNRYMDRFINFFNCATYHSHNEKNSTWFSKYKMQTMEQGSQSQLFNSLRGSLPQGQNQNYHDLWSLFTTLPPLGRGTCRSVFILFLGRLKGFVL